MAFNSIIFLAWFLPFLLLIYYLSPGVMRNAILLIFNLIFLIYGSLSDPTSLGITAAVILLNYVISLALYSNRKKVNSSRAILAFAVIFNIGLLFTFKYLNLFKGIGLPMGISFYIFQSVSYLADIKMKKTKVETSILHYLNYMLFFPQFVSGPIVRHGQISEALHERTYNRKQFFSGIEEFILGLTIKAVLADQLGGIWFKIEAIGYDSISTPLAWLGIVAYSLQLYLDFAGYSMMAIGLGRMFGFELPQNFDYPYMSTSMTEFWRRWHMTLGQWFKDYIYIPLGGNRKGAFRTYLNLFAVWLFTALWHGVEWNFLYWGLFLFIIICIEKAGLMKFMNRFKVIGHVYMIILIPLSWMLFAIHSASGIWIYLQRLIGLGGGNVYASDFSKYVGMYKWFLLGALLCSTKLPRILYTKLKFKPLQILVLLGLLAGSVYMIYVGENNPFMYFSF